MFVLEEKILTLLPLQHGGYKVCPSTLGSLREAWATRGADSQPEPLQCVPPPSLGAVCSGLSSVLILPLLALVELKMHPVVQSASVSLHHQHDWVGITMEKHLGEGAVYEGLSRKVNLKTHLEHGCHHLINWGPRLNKEGKAS